MGTPQNLDLERHSQVAIVSFLKNFPFWGRTLWDYSYAIPNGQMLAGNAKQRARLMNALKAQGLRTGASDLVIAVPRGRFHGLYLEMKRETKYRVSEDQEEFLDRMSDAGYRAAVAPGYNTAVQIVSEYMALGDFRAG